MLASYVPIDWQKFLSFLEDRRPGLPNKIHGASPADLEALRRRSPVPLPENYLGFLRHFGGEDGGFRVFPRHFYLVRELLHEVIQDPLGWDPSRCLLIGIMESRDCEDPHDLFLDLSQADATDAPLVGLDPDPEEPNAECFPIAPSLADRLIIQIAWRLVDRPKKAKARLVAFGNPSSKGTAVPHLYRELVSVAEKLGFVACVSATSNTWMGRQGRETFALIHASQECDLAAMDLCGDDPIPIAQVREVVEDLGLAEPMSVLPD